MARRIVIFLAFCSLVGCIDRTRVNGRCEWSAERIGSLDLRLPEHQQHLYEDVELVDELAVRYADLVHKEATGYEGHGGLLDNGRVLTRCMDSLLMAIATTHQIPVERVREARMRGHRPIAWDTSVIGAFGVLYVLMAWTMTRLISRRFDVEERWFAVGSLALASLGVSAAGVQLGSLWSMTFELIRIGNDHFGGYRASRIPWDDHIEAIYIAGVMIFWSVVAIHHGVSNRIGREKAQVCNPRTG